MFEALFFLLKMFIGGAIAIIAKECITGGGIYIGADAARVGYAAAKKENEKHGFFK